MEYPKFKVCCRCFTFNQAKYITDTMNGFTMQQTSFPFVCCIVDDASTDGEQDVIRKYVEDNFDFSEDSVAFYKETDYAHITYAQHKTNKNCYFAVLYLKENHYSQRKPKMGYLSEWRDMCEYEALCEGDDYWIVPDKLQKQYTVMENNQSISLCHSGFSFLYSETGNFLDYVQKDVSGSLIEAILDSHRYRIQTCTVFFRRVDYINVISSDDFLYKSGYFLMGDTQLWVGLLNVGIIYYDNTISSVYRIATGSACRKTDNRSKYRFDLSCNEMRMYVSQKIETSREFRIKLRKNYNRSLLLYSIFDTSFKSLFDVSNVTKMCLYLVKLPVINGIMRRMINVYEKKCK